MKEIILSLVLLYAANQTAIVSDVPVLSNSENIIVQSCTEENLDTEPEFIEREYISYTSPSKSDFKSYMSYKAITNKSSQQYKLQTEAYTAEHGIRAVDGRYCVAMGSYYAVKIGTHIDLIMENGSIIECILADCKSNMCTDAANQQDINNNSVVEFIVDMSSLDKNAKKMGDISYADDKFKGNIKEIKVYVD